MRIADADGHLWPHTGHRCPVCRMPADPSLNGDPHPTCCPPVVAEVVSLAVAVELLAQAVGAEPIGYYTTRWLVSGAALPSAPTAAHRQEAS